MKVILISIMFFMSFVNAEDRDYPSSISLAVVFIIDKMSEKDKLTIKQTDKLDLIQFHHGFGTGIRNRLGLWRGNSKLINAACGKPCHPDDASGVIIFAVWSKLNDIPFDKVEYSNNLEKAFQINLGKL